MGTMSGPLERIVALFKSVSPGADEDTHICIQCGTGFERDYHSCPSCNCQFVAPANDCDGSHSDA